MLVKFTDDENKPVLVSSDDVTVVAQARNDDSLRLLTIAAGGVKIPIQVAVKESIDEIMEKVNAAIYTEWD